MGRRVSTPGHVPMPMVWEPGSVHVKCFSQRLANRLVPQTHRSRPLMMLLREGGMAPKNMACTQGSREWGGQITHSTAA